MIGRKEGQVRIMQLLPAMQVGGVERGVMEIDTVLKDLGVVSLIASAGGSLVSKLKGQHIRCCTLSRRDPVCVLILNPILLAFLVRRYRISVLHVRSRCLVLSALIACLISPR